MKGDPLTIIHGDALSSLRTLESESVQCVVTSPPYWGLRDYGLDPIVRGGDPNCSGHNGKNGYGEEYGRDAVRGKFCECGAWRGCFGLEPTPEMYVEHAVEVFREVKRVLRCDGTLWLNLGDSYCTTAPGTGMAGNSATSTLIRNPRLDKQDAERARNVRPLTPEGLKPKDLVGVPWRVAFALQADGWYLRSDIIWAKRNCMPESVTDRPTRSHEYLFLLSKNQRYYYDAAAIAEPSAYPGDDRARRADLRKLLEPLCADGGSRQRTGNPTGATRNRRSVWTVATAPFSGAHFATYPPKLIEPCILAGSEAGGVVLDPFAGSGTTGKTAIELGRKAILIEPKAEYVEMIRKRCQTTIGLPLAI